MDENFFTQARYKKTFSPKWTLQAQAKFNHSWNKYEDTDVKYENGKQTDINRQDEYYLSAAVLYQPVKGLELSLAQDGFINTLHTNINDSPNPVRYSSLTALNARYQWGRIKLSGTLVGDFHYGRSKSREYSRRPETPVAHPVRFHSAMERRTIIRPRNV